MTHTVYIDLTAEAARAATTGEDLPEVALKLRSNQVIAFAFMTGGVVDAVSGWVSGRVVVKETPADSPFLLDTTLAETGADTSKRYSAAWSAADCDSAALRAFLGDATLPKECWVELEWTDAEGTKAVSFPITFAPSFFDPSDVAPDPAAEESDAWLSARAVRFDEAQSLSGEQVAQALANLGMTGIKSIVKTAGGFVEIVDDDDNTFHFGLNAGSAPA